MIEEGSGGKRITYMGDHFPCTAPTLAYGLISISHQMAHRLDGITRSSEPLLRTAANQLAAYTAIAN
jgi:hypothetical protein